MRSPSSHKQPRTPRRAAQFWSPLNTWWRSYLAEHNRRPCTTELQEWYNQNADEAWPVGKPTWKEARIHAKCLRSTEQVKQYFREYRARGKAGAGEGSRAQSEQQQNSGDTDAFEGSPALPEQGGMLVVGQTQGAPDTMELLVASHNARLSELNGAALATFGNLGSPFAAQTLAPNAFFNTPRASLAAPVWQQGKASSERFTTATRTSILDGLGAALGDRSHSFGAGPLGASMSFNPNRLDKGHGPFSVPGSLNRERVSCPTPHSADLAGTWSDGMLHTSSPAYGHGAPRHRRLTEFTQMPTVGSDPQPSGSGAGLRYTRSFTIHGTGPQGGGVHMPASQGTDADWLGDAELQGGAGEGRQSVIRKDLLRMVAQDALGGDGRRTSRGTQGAATSVRSRRPDSNQPDTEFAELWALTEDEPATEAPYATSHPLTSGVAYLQDASGQQLQVAGVLIDRASAASDPGPTHALYPRSGSFPSASPRTSCLSTEGPSHPLTLLSSFQRSPSHVRGPLGIASAVAAAAANAAALANRRLSDTGSDGGPLSDSQRSSLPAAMFAREYPRSVLVSNLSGASEALLVRTGAQDLQQQQLSAMQGSRTRAGLSEQDREALEQQQAAVASHNSRLWAQRARGDGLVQALQSDMAAAQAGQGSRSLPWTWTG